MCYSTYKLTNHKISNINKFYTLYLSILSINNKKCTNCKFLKIIEINLLEKKVGYKLI